jgi:hypothetical protein
LFKSVSVLCLSACFIQSLFSLSTPPGVEPYLSRLQAHLPDRSVCTWPCLPTFAPLLDYRPLPDPEPACRPVPLPPFWIIDLCLTLSLPAAQYRCPTSGLLTSACLLLFIQRGLHLGLTFIPDRLIVWCRCVAVLSLEKVS